VRAASSTWGELDVRQLGHDSIDREPRRADVEEREDARLVGRDHVVAEPAQRHPPRAARIHHRSDAVGERGLVGVTTGGETVVDVRVDVDQPGRDERARRIDHLGGLARQRLRHRGHLATPEGHITSRRDRLRGIDQRATADEQVPGRHL